MAASPPPHSVHGVHLSIEPPSQYTPIEAFNNMDEAANERMGIEPEAVEEPIPVPSNNVDEADNGSVGSEPEAVAAKPIVPSKRPVNSEEESRDRSSDSEDDENISRDLGSRRVRHGQHHHRDEDGDTRGLPRGLGHPGVRAKTPKDDEEKFSLIGVCDNYFEMKSMFTLPDWELLLRNDLPEIYARALERHRTLVHVATTIDTIKAYTYNVSVNGLKELAQLSLYPDIVPTIRHALEPMDLNEVINLELLGDLFGKLRYDALYDLLDAVEDLSVIATKGLIVIHKMPCLEEGDADELEDLSLIDLEEKYKRMMEWTSNTANNSYDIARTIRGPIHRSSPKMVALRTSQMIVDRKVVADWMAQGFSKDVREDKLLSMMKELLYGKDEKRRVIVDKDVLTTSWKQWKALDQYDGVEDLLQHWKDLKTALVTLDQRFGRSLGSTGLGKSFRNPISID
ncbi:hypothetical protein HBH70_151480 [Parastagonospora nodorum]|nr:hypothetical protein HBH53_167450 [Parastagonospora nodorum]KAH3965388.1 hypothetical protein HBH51_150790 [Parastagonospora nodorum]KAH4000158.1 hypothetical protein HBI10_110700 [Parastagonospora nodorum]KAH4022129.1 hypothetical protein HBI13_098520 [Parastagonospora nodorum]KAH4027870.1 hypothetical protein HBI09_144330 [Parastagonospora nodorum]